MGDCIFLVDFLTLKSNIHLENLTHSHLKEALSLRTT